MPMPGAVEPTPLPSRESRFSVPLEAQQASFRGVRQDLRLALSIHP